MLLTDRYEICAKLNTEGKNNCLKLNWYYLCLKIKKKGFKACTRSKIVNIKMTIKITILYNKHQNKYNQCNNQTIAED